VQRANGNSEIDKHSAIRTRFSSLVTYEISPIYTIAVDGTFKNNTLIFVTGDDVIGGGDSIVTCTLPADVVFRDGQLAIAVMTGGYT
jgi:hypothetical protein